MRAALLSSLLAVTFLLSQSSQAASQLDSATLKQLTMLEQKFFGHGFAAESDDDRTQRIEKLIFGTAAEGAAADRIKKLASVTLLDTRPDPLETPQKQAEPSLPVKTETSRQPKKKDLPPQDDAQSDNPPVSEKSGADDYPHVTALEKDILGSTYAGQLLSARIVRMETKAFGAPSKSADLGERTDNLETYAEQKLHKKPFLADETADSSYSTDDAAPGQSQMQSQPQSDYPHVTALETSILGKTAQDQPLEKRLAAMEVKAFGSVSKNPALSDRTDALEKYAEKTLHQKPFGQEENYQTADSGVAGDPQAKASGGRGKKLLSMVGNSLLGMAGVGGIAAGGAPGFSPPGMGIGPQAYGPSGFSGIRVRRRQAAAPDESSAADEPSGPVEDPMVLAKDPPPSSARLAVRVAWCEMHVFGKTSSNMHLAERLTQLNRELNFDPGKSAIELMDGVDSLVKLAQAYKAPPATIGSAPNKAVH